MLLAGKFDEDLLDSILRIGAVDCILGGNTRPFTALFGSVIPPPRNATPDDKVIPCSGLGAEVLASKIGAKPILLVFDDWVIDGDIPNAASR